MIWSKFNCRLCCWMFAIVCKLYVFCWLVDMQEVLDTVWHGYNCHFVRKWHHQEGFREQTPGLLTWKTLSKTMVFARKTLNIRVFPRHLHLVNVYGLENVAKYAIHGVFGFGIPGKTTRLDRSHLCRDSWTCPICPWPRWLEKWKHHGGHPGSWLTSMVLTYPPGISTNRYPTYPIPAGTLEDPFFFQGRSTQQILYGV